MSQLMYRIINVGAGKIGPTSVTVIGKNYQAPTDIPLIRIQIQPGVILYDEMQPLITADGAPVAATSPGTWGQLYAAGRY